MSLHWRHSNREPIGHTGAEGMEKDVARLLARVGVVAGTEPGWEVGGRHLAAGAVGGGEVKDVDVAGEDVVGRGGEGACGGGGGGWWGWGRDNGGTAGGGGEESFGGVDGGGVVGISHDLVLLRGCC